MFLDADMLSLADIHHMPYLIDGDVAPDLWLVKNRLQLEWCSMMVFNNQQCRVLTPDFVDDGSKPLFDLAWTSRVGEISPEWNHCVGYDNPRRDAKLVHFTQGIPFHRETEETEYVEEWRAELESCVSSVSWQEMMGTSVHAKHVLARKGSAR